MSQVGDGEEGRPQAAGKWILIVSDQAVMRDILERFLRTLGHFISTAADGREALFKARSLPIDFVLLDLDMGGGLGLASELRADPALLRLPLLFISARYQARELSPRLQGGATGFLPVPFTLVEVRQLLNAMGGAT
ncbi:MAG TPA: response regulator [Opitutaceae bacterium]|nr:response regulator [Opitutaceae bacterium]